MINLEWPYFQQLKDEIAELDSDINTAGDDGRYKNRPDEGSLW